MNFRNGDQASSFYRILPNNDSEYLPLPSAFAKKYLENGDNKKQIIVLKTQSGVEWRVKYTRIEDRYYFTGGWLKFMNKNHLQLGDLLVFWLRSFDPKPMFEVIIYSPNGCLKNTTSSDDTGLDRKKKPSVEEATSDSVSLKNVDEPLTLLRVVRKTYIYRMPLTRDFVKAAGIDDYGVLRLENIDGKMWDATLGKIGPHQAPVIGAGWFDFTKDNNVNVGSRCVITHVQDNLLRVHVSKKRGRPKRCAKHSSDDTASGNEKNPSVEEATSDSVSLKNVEEPLTLPRVVRKNYIYRMPLTRDFMKAAGIDEYGVMRLENNDGKTWDANFEKSGPREIPVIGRGWPDFRKHNNLKVGNRFVITHVQDNLFRVHVSKKRGRPKRCAKQSSDDTGSGNEKKPCVEEATSDSVSVENVEGSLTFQIDVKESYMHQMPLNEAFAKATRINDYDRLRLENNKGNTWDVSLWNGEPNRVPRIGREWSDFVKDNKVNVGNSCVFTHVQDNLLRVDVIKKRGRPKRFKSKVG
ncbi:putative transcription factor B3-Domain family [Helianthus annuus]|nr:putative transcription factor B3-Domain family [Helianthus annuus]